ncbi:ribonuclease HII [Neotamlana laminarinivorans]|uniref:Ribonuclease HII n=1 Tax=Neotamlana laminarinivorans TaxID=2883124 RepID=A0A9X1L2X0_9FLAO|nr:ribonuclease HII [Tamlana laminarinivorans]MCB4800233.1 ribonuclease HII [Tamlana laminarinivorans]
MRFLFILLLSFICLSCTYSKNNRKDLAEYVPENALAVIKSSNLDGLKNSIKNNSFLFEVSKSFNYLSLEEKLENINYLNPKGEVLICLFKDENDSLQYSLITKFNSEIFKSDSLPNYTEETLTFKTKSITKSKIKNNISYSALIDSTFYISSSQKAVEKAFLKNSYKIPNAYNSLDKDSPFSVYLNSNYLNNETVFFADSLSLKNFSSYYATDIDVTQDAILINGITTVKDSTKSLINVFKNTIPQENQIKNIAPSNCDGFLSLTFDSFNTFNENLKKHKQTDTLQITTLFQDVIEVGVIYEDNNRSIVLNSTDVIATGDALISSRNKKNEFREVEIYEFNTPQIFENTFSPFILTKNTTLYCILDNFFVFSNNIETLQNIIASYQNKTTLATTTYYKYTEAKLSKASSLLQIVNATSLKSILNKNENDATNFNLNKYEANGLQFVYDNNFAHLHAVIQKQKNKVQENSITELLNIKLDKAILTQPQFVKNHITNQKEIIVQDINNNLYLISNKGKILWKKTLKGPILGKVEQIDIYKNGRLQLTFSTPNRIYVIDRNGNDVGPFPLKFNDDITQPLSVFDYDKKKDYRLLVTQGKNILMYNTQGKIVNGFNFTKANDNIIAQPKHFRIGRKDYIAFKTKNKLYILDRRGKTRVTPKVQETYSNNSLYLYKNNFTTTTTSGNLYSVDAKGNVTEQPLNLNENHFIDASSKTLVTLSENLLTIKNKTTELDFGEYTTCKFFYLNDKIYISVTDLQAHKIYLFDSQSKLLKNFPVYGNSSIDLDNIDSNKNLEFVTKGESNSIIVYQLN